MNYGKRGMVLEKQIEYSNQSYKNKGWGLIDKVPTPWNVQYNKRTRQSMAFPKEKGTVDFIGVSHGRAIAFDAKSTNNRTSFPLKNIGSHQLDYLRNFELQGGISFIIVDFAKLQETYFLKTSDLYAWWIQMEGGGRKSIPQSWFYLNCEQIHSGNGIALDYLKYCRTVK